MMIDPKPYRKFESEPVTWFMASSTLDGWSSARWSGRMKGRLVPEEIAEFTKVVKDVLKTCPEYNALRKYFGKHGTQIRCDGMEPTMAFVVEQPLMTYTLEATGPNFWIEARKKEEK